MLEAADHKFPTKGRGREEKTPPTGEEKSLHQKGEKLGICFRYQLERNCNRAKRHKLKRGKQERSKAAKRGHRDVWKHHEKGNASAGQTGTF